MAIQMVRQPSSQPNIENIDDIVPFRYAYGNQNGYVKDKGTEIDYELANNSIIIKSGRIVVQGVEIDIDDAGVQLSLDVVSERRYYVVYCKVDMTNNFDGGQVASLHTTFGIDSYPEIPQSADLTKDSSGMAYLELYRFELQNGVIDILQKTIKEIEYINKDTEIKNATNVTGTIAGKEIEDIFEDDGVTATKAKNVIDNGDGTRSEFIKDNNVLKVGDEIIARRKLFWSGALTTSNVSNSFTIDKRFEKKKYLFVWQADDYQFETIVDMSKLTSHSNPAFAQFFAFNMTSNSGTTSIRSVHFSPVLNSNNFSVNSAWARHNDVYGLNHWQITLTKIYEIID